LRGSSSSRASASQPIRGRQTQNSLRAGEVPGLTVPQRSRSQDPIRNRVERRISASQENQANRRAPSPVLDTVSEVSLLSSFSESSVSFENLKMSLQNTQNIPGPSNIAGPSTSNVGATTQNAVVPTTNQFTTRKMPKPGEKNAPSFDPEKPGELGRFFERMEDWFAEEGITRGENMKKRIVKYLDADSEIQWKAFSKFENGTFAEFKAEVMASYPKAEEVMKGSVSGLKKKIRGIGPIASDERDDLLWLVRVMTAEVLKLKKISPPIHTNRELVELFLGRLTPDFAGRVAQKLSMYRVIAATNPAANPGPVRNPEDMYDIEEVMEMAKQTAHEQANPFGKFLWGMNGGQSQSSNVKLEEAVARLTDSVNLQNQRTKQIDQKIASMHSYFNQPRNSATNPGTQEPRQESYRPPNAYAGAEKCYYCSEEGHIARNCEHARRHISSAWVVRQDNLLRLPDGSKIQRDGGKSLKDIVESLNQNRPGIIPMSKIQNKSGFYQDSAQLMDSFVQTRQTENVEADNMRLLADVFRQVGVETVRKFMNQEAPRQQQVLEEIEEEWGQNFD
jgi:Zinc knuckle